MDIKEIRRENLRVLVQKSAGQSAFSRTIGKSAAYINQILSPNVRGEVGNALARKIEETLGLESLWMDVDHDEVKPNLVTMYDTTDVNALVNDQPLVLKRREKVISEYSELGERAFAFKIASDEMSPEISQGATLIVDPDVEPRPGMIVVVSSNNGFVFVRKLQISISGELLLKASDPRLPIETYTKEMKIVGEVVEAFISQYRKISHTG